MATRQLPPLPHSWSELTWQQLCQVWAIKMRYGGNPDVARCAALLALLDCSVCRDTIATIDPATGEQQYTLTTPLHTGRGRGRVCWTVTPRTLAHLAAAALPWFDYPYGDPGQKEERDEKGAVIKERREAVNGLVSAMRDAMILPEEVLKVGRKTFALPQVACNNLTWQQYRSLQALAPQLFAEGNTPEQALRLQAQFLAHILVPRSLALLDADGRSIRVRPHFEHRYNAEQAEHMAAWWEKRLKKEKGNTDFSLFTFHFSLSVLFHICFQTYQTALHYYERAYPLLFQDSGKSDPMRDALQGEVGTINTIMKYAGYAEQQQVYDSNLPFVLDILNTMTKEAKEIEKMNSKIKRK